MSAKLTPVPASQQRFPTSAASARELACHYFDWLQSATLGLVRTTGRGPDGFTIRMLGLPLIRLARDASAGREQERLAISGGLLAQPGGSFAFAVRDEQAVVTLDGYRSRYPLALYRVTQAPLHELVMARYGAWWRRRTT